MKVRKKERKIEINEEFVVDAYLDKKDKMQTEEKKLGSNRR